MDNLAEGPNEVAPGRMRRSISWRAIGKPPDSNPCPHEDSGHELFGQYRRKFGVVYGVY